MLSRAKNCPDTTSCHSISLILFTLGSCHSCHMSSATTPVVHTFALSPQAQNQPIPQMLTTPHTFSFKVQISVQTSCVHTFLFLSIFLLILRCLLFTRAGHQSDAVSVRTHRVQMLLHISTRCRQDGSPSQQSPGLARTNFSRRSTTSDLTAVALIQTTSWH